jgi:hypothetical protein
LIKTFMHFELGVEKINQSRIDSKTQQPEVSTNSYSNSYWWGVAITYSDTETKQMIFALLQTAAVGALIASIAAFVPAAQVGAIVAAIEAAGALMIANSMSYHNQGNGVTLNLHWLPFVYYEVTPNY